MSTERLLRIRRLTGSPSEDTAVRLDVQEVKSDAHYIFVLDFDADGLQPEIASAYLKRVGGHDPPVPR